MAPLFDQKRPNLEGRAPRILGSIDARVFFTFTKGTSLYEDGADGTFTGEVWASDGSKRGTVRIRPEGPLAQTANHPATDRTLFFWDKAYGDSRLCRTDGTADSTSLVDASLNFYQDGNAFLFGSQTSRDFCRIGGVIFFEASERTHGAGIWCSDGTPQGTRLLKKYEGNGWWKASQLIALGDQVLFMLDGGNDGCGLWVSDGTIDGTRFLGNGDPRQPFFQSSWPWVCFAKAGGKVFFACANESSGYQLWQTDGTPAGTIRMELDSPLSRQSPYAFEMIGVGSSVYFTWDTEMDGVELWKTDGTAGGTRPVSDVTGDSMSASPSSLLLCGTQLLFRANTLATGNEIYRLDVRQDLSPSAP
jgi:ELWxxDGT repeat protein